MKIGIIYFSFKNDLLLLLESLKGISRLKVKYPNYIIDTYVFDDGNNPLEVIPNDIIYRQTTFNRRNNLNGYECVSGMITAYNEMLQYKNYDWIIKVDCDTIINHLDFLKGLDPNEYGEVGSASQPMQENTSVYVEGPCHVYGIAGIKYLIEKIKEKEAKLFVNLAWLEDKAHSYLLNKNPELKNKYYPKFSEGSLYHFYDDNDDYDISTFIKYYALEFKRCCWHTDASKWQDEREHAIKRMQIYNAKIKSIE